MNDYEIVPYNFIPEVVSVYRLILSTIEQNAFAVVIVEESRPKSVIITIIFVKVKFI